MALKNETLGSSPGAKWSKTSTAPRRPLSPQPRHLGPGAGPGPIFSVAAASFCTISFQTNGFPLGEVISVQPKVGRAGFLPWALPGGGQDQKMGPWWG